MENYAVHKTRTHLMGLTDRQLKDAGISRHLLQKGVDAWPWRENHNQEANHTPQMSDREIDSAIRELSSPSNLELRDIGIDRGTIRHSVMHGLASQEHRKAA